MVGRMIRSRVLAPLLLVLLAPAALAEGRPPILVELYTSQGCNSCPPADKALKALAKRADVVPLSLHVDYWDYLGWRDTFARHAHTERQHRYRAALGERAVYTPQVVVQGQEGVVGSKAETVDAAIAAAKTRASPARISLQAGPEGFAAEVAPVGDGAAGPLRVYRAVYDLERRVKIGRGENRGRTLAYANVVRELEAVAEWDGTAPARYEIAPPGPGQGVAVWLQRGAAGPVLCAAKHEG